MVEPPEPTLPEPAAPEPTLPEPPAPEPTAPDKTAPDKSGRWFVLTLLLPLFFGVLGWGFGSQAVDGYRATHQGIPGTAVVTDVDRGRGEDAGSVSVTGDFTPSGGGPVLRHVSIETRTAYVGEHLQVNASGPNANSVYPPDSWDWIGSTVAGGVFGVVSAGMLFLVIWSWVSSYREKSKADRPD